MSNDIEYKAFWDVDSLQKMKDDNLIADFKVEGNTAYIVPIVCAKDIEVTIGFIKDPTNLNDK